MIKSASPFSIPESSLSFAIRPSSRNFTSGPLSSPSLTWKFAIPFAPSAFARPSRSESSLRESAAPPGRRSPLIVPPPATSAAKGFSPPAKTSSSGTISSGIRISGLSMPYLFIASSQVMRRKGVFTSTPLISLKSPAR